jgi:hypothetical protein
MRAPEAPLGIKTATCQVIRPKKSAAHKALHGEALVEEEACFLWLGYDELQGHDIAPSFVSPPDDFS